MDSSGSNPQYQRAVTPTLEKVNVSNPNPVVRGKPLSYQQSKRQQIQLPRQTITQNIVGSFSQKNSNYPNPQQQQAFLSKNNEVMNIQGKSASGQQTNSMSRGILLSGKYDTGTNILRPNNEEFSNSNYLSSNPLPRADLALISEEIPTDGVIFARLRSNINTLVVFRTPEERSRNPERLNLDRRQLDMCPLLENEHRLRLLNYQNNNIYCIQNLDNLPNLIFLDLYNNKISTLEGSLSILKTLRVLMAGKNKIPIISNLTNLRKLDVLDLHSNEIKEIQGFETLSDLRVLNLAGNMIQVARNLGSLQSLTELNLRRNCIESVEGLEATPSLQRIFLSHNKIASYDNISCLFNSKYLLELSLDGNPIIEANVDISEYRYEIIKRISCLRHLDLKRITEEERVAAKNFKSNNLTLIPDLSSENLSSLQNGFEDNLSSEDLNTNTESSITLARNVHSFYNLAKLGKIGSSTSFFEIEPFGSDEKFKSLVISGDAWEFNHPKRVLTNIVELLLTNVNKEMIVRKLNPILPSLNLNALKVLRLINTNIQNLVELYNVLELFPFVENLEISSSSICSIKFLPQFCIKCFSNLKYYNDTEISNQDKNYSHEIMDSIYKQMLIIKQLNKQSNMNKSLSKTKLMTTSFGSSSSKFNYKNYSSGNDQNLSNTSDDIITDIIRNSIKIHSISNTFNAAFNSCLKDLVFNTLSDLKLSNNS